MIPVNYARIFALVVLCTCHQHLSAQTTSLSLSSATASSGGTVVLSLSLSAPGAAPAGLGWTLLYAPGQVSAIAEFAGPVAAAAGKTISCASVPGAINCLLSGPNTNAMASGVVATVQLTLAPTAGTTSISIANPIGVNTTGSVITALAGTTGIILVPTISSVACTPASLNSSVRSSCMVTLNTVAPTGGATVTLASNNTLLSVPASLTVPAGATTGTFSPTAAASIPGNQTAAVTATLGPSSQSAIIALLSPVLVSGLACSPTVLGPGGSSTCSVSLSQALPPITQVHVTSCGPQISPATCTIPSTGSGNLIVVGWQSGAGADTTVSITGITDNAGNSYAEAGPARSIDTAARSVADIWYARNSAAGATTLTITTSSPVSGGTAVIRELSGVDVSDPLDQTAILNSQNESTAPLGAAVTTTATAEVVVSLTTAANVTGILAGNAFTVDSTAGGNASARFMSSSTGTYAAQWSQSPAGTYASSTASFRASGRVLLTSNNPLLNIPASVTVPLGASTTSFSATAAAGIANNQTATITADFSNRSQSASIDLIVGNQTAIVSTNFSNRSQGAFLDVIARTGEEAGASSGGSTMTASPTDLTIDATPSRGPATQTITLTYRTYTRGAPAWSSNLTTNQGDGWLSISPRSGTMTQTDYAGSLYTYQTTVTVLANPTGIGVGAPYTGTANFQAGGRVASANITMNVSPPTRQLSVGPESLAFSHTQGDSTQPAAQSISVFSHQSGGPVSASAIMTNGETWLNVSGDRGTPSLVTTSVNPNLPPGIYSATVAVSSGANTVNVPVTYTVANRSARLSVSPLTAGFTLSRGTTPALGQVAVSNVGGGTLQFTAQAVSDQGSWLTLTGSGSGTAASEAQASLSFMADPTGLSPGLYTGQISVRDSNSPAGAVVKVTLAVSETAQTIILSQSGITFSAVEGGQSPPSQVMTVSSQGIGPLYWSAQAETIPNPLSPSARWLSVVPPTGSSISGQAGSTLEIFANPTGLPAGQYFGSVKIDAPGAFNNPQSVLVILNVGATSDTSRNVGFSTGGVILTGLAGNAAAQQQQISIFNPSNETIGYSATVLTSNGIGWLSLSPASGRVLPGSTSISIAANFSMLSPGLQTGTVTLGFDDGTVGIIQVSAIATSPTQAARNNAISSTGSGVSPSCSQSFPNSSSGYLVPIFRQPVAPSVLQVAMPQKIQLEIVDDCGRPLAAGNGGLVQVSFSNQDASINLHDAGGGIWEGTWTPVNAGAQVTLRVMAAELSTVRSSNAAAVGVAVQPASPNAPPQISGVVNTAGSAQPTPQTVTPGSYVAIYGTSLAANGMPLAESLPLPTTLNDTRLLLGNQQLPLLYAGPGQVNALIPRSLNPNTAYQLIVQRGATSSVPVPLTIAQYQPGIYTLDLSGSGQGMVEVAGTTMLAAPTGSGSRPVQRGSEYLAIFATGLGPVVGANGEAPPADGAPAPLTTIYRTTASVTATIAGIDAPVVFSGLSPSLVAVYQVNVQVPAAVPTGSSVPLVLTVTDPVTGKDLQSNTVMIAVQ